MGKTESCKLLIGGIYFLGACLLLPGFLWIIPTAVVTLHIPVHFNNVTHKPDHFITVPDVPQFSVKYGDGVRILIWGMLFIIAGAVLDLLAVHCVAAMAMGKNGALRVAGPFFQVLGAATILWGCIVFLPSNQGLNWDGTTPHGSSGPKEMFGMKASDLGNLLFKIGSVLYCLSAVLGIVGICHGITQARQSGKRTVTLWMSIPAFLLFMCTSTLYYINGCMPKADAVQAGWLRMVGTICLFVAVLILCLATVLEVCDGGSKAKADFRDIHVSLNGVRTETA